MYSEDSIRIELAGRAKEKPPDPYTTQMPCLTITNRPAACPSDENPRAMSMHANTRIPRLGLKLRASGDLLYPLCAGCIRCPEGLSGLRAKHRRINPSSTDGASAWSVRHRFSAEEPDHLANGNWRLLHAREFGA